MYGIEEVYEKQKILGSHLHLNEEERSIALRDTRENYKKAQDIALSIEAIIWHTLNKNKMRLEANYNMKNRELLNYLMDDGNYELRLCVLTGEKKPEFLCKASGKVYFLLRANLIYGKKTEQRTYISNHYFYVRSLIPSYPGIFECSKFVTSRDSSTYIIFLYN